MNDIPETAPVSTEQTPQAPANAAPSAAQAARSAEDLARSLGWKPKSEWKGDQSLWSPADVFLEHGFKAGERSRKEVKELKKGITDLRHFYKTDAEERAQRTIEQYKNERAQAIKAGDVDRVEALDGKIEQAKEKLKPLAEEDEDEIYVRAETEVEQMFENNPLAVAFFQANAWVLDDNPDADRAYKWMEKYGDDLLAKGKTPVEMLEELERALKKMYPQKYEQKRATPAKDPRNGQFMKQPPAMERPGRSAGQPGMWGRQIPMSYLEIAQQEVKEGLFENVDAWGKAFLKSKGIEA